MRVVIAGASGFFGSRLARHLKGDGHQVVRLVRRPARGADEIPWDPAQGRLDPAAVAACGVLVNMAGANIGTRRWTPRYRAEIRSSRVDTTGLLARTVAALPAADRPAVFLAQSAVGFYGGTGDRAATEDDGPGEGFLTGVVREWEAATRPAQDAGIRVVQMRTGLPLDRHGGMLQPMLWQFRLFAGGRMGSGRQWIPWISVVDWLRAMDMLRDNETFAGPVNVVGPQPVRNAEFASVLGRVLHRPALIPVPEFALRIALGEFAHEALASYRVLPAALLRNGFSFQHSTVESALRAALAQG